MRTHRGVALSSHVPVAAWGVILTGVLLLTGRESVLAPSALGSKAHASHRPARPRDVRIATADLDYRFRPQHITVRAGTTVIWINRTAAPHTITIARGRTLNATVGPFRRVSHTFRRTGTYPYFCRYHPYMLGVVTVTS